MLTHIFFHHTKCINQCHRIEPYWKVSLSYVRQFKMADRHFEPCVWPQTKLSLTGITMQPNTDVGRRHQSPAKPLLFLMPQIH